jgi:REP element-mobilizing transposase RayT
MSQSLVQIYLHIIFSTKNREPFLTDKPFRDRTHAYLVGIWKNLDCRSLIVGGVENHVHILCRYSKTIELKDFLRDLKRDSSVWIKEQNSQLSNFYWQAGYGAFSVSPSHVDPLTNYIASQEEHDRHESYQDAYRRICRKYGVPIDERYVWD